MSQKISYYGVQSLAFTHFYVRVSHRPDIRFGLDGKKWYAYSLLPKEDLRLKSPSRNIRADYIFVDPASKLDGRGLVDVYLVSAEQENVKVLMPACRFKSVLY